MYFLLCKILVFSSILFAVLPFLTVYVQVPVIRFYHIGFHRCGDIFYNLLISIGGVNQDLKNNVKCGDTFYNLLISMGGVMNSRTMLSKIYYPTYKYVKYKRKDLKIWYGPLQHQGSFASAYLDLRNWNEIVNNNNTCFMF